MEFAVGSIAVASVARVGEGTVDETGNDVARLWAAPGRERRLIARRQVANESGISRNVQQSCDYDCFQVYSSN